MNYSRIDARIDYLKWQMEDAQRRMNDMRNNLKRIVDGSDLEVAEFGSHYAKKFEEAFNEYKRDAEEVLALAKIKEEMEAQNGNQRD